MEMVRLLKDCQFGYVDIIFTQTKGYLAANNREFCYLIKFLFSMTHRIDIITEDDSYNINTLVNDDIIKSLGYPKHVCLRINESNRSFAIIPCEANDVMSFKIPEKLFTDSKCVFRINSKSFLISLVLKYNLDPTFVYSCKGI